MHKEEIEDNSFVSQEFTSGTDESGDENMVNYIDQRKPYVKFKDLSKRDQIDRLFFMWQMLVRKLRGSVYLI